MRPGSVGEKCRIMARAAGGVEDRQPRLSRGIEAARRDLLESAPGSLLTVLAVDIEQLGKGLHRCAERARSAPGECGRAAVPEYRGFRRCAWRYSWELWKPAVMCRGCKFLQTFNAQILVELPRGYFADSGHRLEQLRATDVTAFVQRRARRHSPSQARRRKMCKASDIIRLVGARQRHYCRYVKD